MRIGYPCMNLSLSCRSSRTFRLDSYSEDRMHATVKNNLDCLMEILMFNAEKNLLFFRITSDLIPFASHPVCRFPWKKEFVKHFRDIGRFIKRHRMRVSMHPDQFVLINSPDRDIFRRSVAELQYHADILDLLGTGPASKIQIHIGGAYGDKGASIDRFIKRFRMLPDSITKRLVIENDERIYSVRDCISVHRRTGIPVVFDTLHHECNNGGGTMLRAFSNAHATWRRKDGLPIVDYSVQDTEKRKGAHARSLQTRHFKDFLEMTDGYDFDIMFEIKDKEKSALKAAAAMGRLKR
jgi:UV DNA damage endonuclease